MSSSLSRTPSYNLIPTLSNPTPHTSSYPHHPAQGMHSPNNINPNPHQSYPTSSSPAPSASTPTPSMSGGGGGGDSADPASKRREANRLAAARFRTRKKDQVVDLEGRVAALEAENVALRGEIRNLRGMLGIRLDKPVKGVGVAGAIAAGIGGVVRQSPGLGGEEIQGERQGEYSGQGQSQSRNNLLSPSAGTSTTSDEGGADLSRSLSSNSRSGDRSIEYPMREAGGGGSEYGSASESLNKKRKLMEDENMGVGMGASGGGGGGGAEVDMMREQMRGYQATMRVMQEEIALLRGKSVQPMGAKGRTPSYNLDPMLTGQSSSNAGSGTIRQPSSSSSHNNANNININTWRQPAPNSRTTSSSSIPGGGGMGGGHQIPTLAEPSPGSDPDDTIAAQRLASLHLPFPQGRPGYDRGESGYSGVGAGGGGSAASGLSLPPLSPVLRINSASPSSENPNYLTSNSSSNQPFGGPTLGRTIHNPTGSRPISPSNMFPGLGGAGGGINRPASPMSLERLNSPSPYGYGSPASSAKTLHALQNAALALGGMSTPISGSPSGRSSPVHPNSLVRTRSWAGGGLGSMPTSRSGSRGLDSPVSAERSGAGAMDDDEDSPDGNGDGDYFGRYALPSIGVVPAPAAGGTGGSRLKQERDFEDDDTPPGMYQDRKDSRDDVSMSEGDRRGSGGYPDDPDNPEYYKSMVPDDVRMSQDDEPDGYGGRYGGQRAGV